MCSQRGNAAHVCHAYDATCVGTSRLSRTQACCTCAQAWVQDEVSCKANSTLDTTLPLAMSELMRFSKRIQAGKPGASNARCTQGALSKQ
eukprot:557548-Amphidinium_carterae.1